MGTFSCRLLGSFDMTNFYLLKFSCFLTQKRVPGTLWKMPTSRCGISNFFKKPCFILVGTRLLIVSSPFQWTRPENIYWKTRKFILIFHFKHECVVSGFPWLYNCIAFPYTKSTDSAGAFLVAKNAPANAGDVGVAPEDFTGCGATKPNFHSHRVPRACTPQ